MVAVPRRSRWQRNQANFVDKKYSREHIWKFDGGIEVGASSSPQVVPLPYSNPTCVDPEEAFVAALSSCHMLSFLYIAAKKKYVVESYSDRAVGYTNKIEGRKVAVTNVTLRPQVIFAGDNLPTERQVEEMHEEAHDICFIANSVKTEINIESDFTGVKPIDG